mmetsp:Transcript_5915/g.17421  ORF Transcript_5915/g.17421 Transcript_5915/m.17421 type:complete len:202 (+) Transcript_5915:162-767(+)
MPGRRGGPLRLDENREHIRRDRRRARAHSDGIGRRVHLGVVRPLPRRGALPQPLADHRGDGRLRGSQRGQLDTRPRLERLHRHRLHRSLHRRDGAPHVLAEVGILQQPVKRRGHVHHHRGHPDRDHRAVAARLQRPPDVPPAPPGPRAQARDDGSRAQPDDEGHALGPEEHLLGRDPCHPGAHPLVHRGRPDDPSAEQEDP